MTCQLCEGLGMIALGVDVPGEGYQDIAICLCRKGLNLRAQIDRGLYALLAKTHGIPIENIGLIEEMVDPADLPPSLRPKVKSVDIGAAGMKPGKAKL